MIGSKALHQPGSELMSMVPVTIKVRVDAWGLDSYQRPSPPKPLDICPSLEKGGSSQQGHLLASFLLLNNLLPPPCLTGVSVGLSGSPKQYQVFSVPMNPGRQYSWQGEGVSFTTSLQFTSR